MKPTKKRRPYSKQLLAATECYANEVKEEDTLLPSERGIMLVDVEWNPADEVDIDELVYYSAYRI